MINNKPYVIAETAYTFEGNYEYLLEQTKNLPKSVDAIKYHLLFDISEYMVPSHTVYSLLQTWMLSEDQWLNILNEAKRNNHDVIVLADDSQTIKFLKENVSLVDGLEIHAACINDKRLLDCAIDFSNQYNKMLYIGISGFELTELFDIHDYLISRNCQRVTLMYGFQNYPTKIEDIQLNKIPLYRELFDRNVGYADHTGFDEQGKLELIEAAYALGANVQEIHYTLHEGEKRTDSVTGLSGEHIAQVKEKLLLIHKAIGKRDIRMNEGEKKYLNFRKVPAYADDFEKGHIIGNNDILFTRIENPTRQHRFSEESKFIGKKLLDRVLKEEEILDKDFE